MARKGRKSKQTHQYWRYVLIGVFAIFFVFIAYNGTVTGFRKADLFKVKNVIKAPSLQYIESRHTKHLVGKSIFVVDLKKTQRKLRTYYPQIDDLKVLRRFPDKIYLTATRRDPYAFTVMDGKEIVFDRDSVVLSFRRSGGTNLPYIKPLEIKANPILGKPFRRNDVRTALEIIQTVEENQHLESYRVETIDVNNLSMIDFNLSNKLKVIIDREKIPQKIAKLGILLSQGNIVLDDVNYIDLRFKEPILSKK